MDQITFTVSCANDRRNFFSVAAHGTAPVKQAICPINVACGWPGSPNWSSSYVSPGTRLQDRSFSVRLSQYADLFFRRPAFAFHSSDSFG